MNNSIVCQFTPSKEKRTTYEKWYSSFEFVSNYRFEAVISLMAETGELSWYTKIDKNLVRRLYKFLGKKGTFEDDMHRYLNHHDSSRLALSVWKSTDPEIEHE